MSHATSIVIVVAAAVVVVALCERQRRIRKAKHRRTLADMYQPAPKVKPPPPDEK